MIIYGLTVAAASFVAGMGLGAIFSASAYYKGYEDGSREMHDDFLGLDKERRLP